MLGPSRHWRSRQRSGAAGCVVSEHSREPIVICCFERRHGRYRRADARRRTRRQPVSRASRDRRQKPALPPSVSAVTPNANGAILTPVGRSRHGGASDRPRASPAGAVAGSAPPAVRRSSRSRSPRTRQPPRRIAQAGQVVSAGHSVVAQARRDDPDHPDRVGGRCGRRGTSRPARRPRPASRSTGRGRPRPATVRSLGGVDDQEGHQADLRQRVTNPITRVRRAGGARRTRPTPSTAFAGKPRVRAAVGVERSAHSLRQRRSRDRDRIATTNARASRPRGDGPARSPASSAGRNAGHLDPENTRLRG